MPFSTSTGLIALGTPVALTGNRQFKSFQSGGQHGVEGSRGVCAREDKADDAGRRRDIELVKVSGNSARVRLTGMCAGCPSAHMTLHMGVEMALREEIREFEELQVV